MKQKLLKILYNFLALCARISLSRHKIQVIAITGSVGKTSCRMIVAEVLKQLNSEKIIYTSPKNYNSELGLVFSIFQIEDYHPSTKNLLKLSGKIFCKALFGVKNMDILVAEYGIDSPWDMEHLLKVAVPDIAVLTKLDAVHSANFPLWVDEYWQEKWKLLLAAKKKVYLNLEDEFSKNHIELLKDYKEIFSRHKLRVELKKDQEDIARWGFNYLEIEISHNLLGEENNYYVMLWIDIAMDIGLEFREKKYDFHLTLQPWRFTLFSYKEHILIDGSYNAAPESVKQVIVNTVLLQKKLFSDYGFVAVFGDMRELAYPQQAHENIVSEISFFDAIFTVGPYMYAYIIPKLKEIGFTGTLSSSLSSRDIGIKLKNFLDVSSQKYLVVFKGSQNTIFTEEALAVLLSPENQKKLPRQSEAWKVRKEEFFSEL